MQIVEFTTMCAYIKNLAWIFLLLLYSTVGEFPKSWSKLRLFVFKPTLRLFFLQTFLFSALQEGAQHFNDFSSIFWVRLKSSINILLKTSFFDSSSKSGKLKYYKCLGCFIHLCYTVAYFLSVKSFSICILHMSFACHINFVFEPLHCSFMNWCWIYKRCPGSEGKV